MRRSNHSWMNSCFHRAIPEHGNSQKVLFYIPVLWQRRYLLWLFWKFLPHIYHQDLLFPVSQRKNYRHLMSGINPFYIKSRIRLGKTQLLCFFQNNIKHFTLVGHFGEDIVGGSVNYAHNRINFVGYQAFFQCSNYGYSSPTLASNPISTPFL